MLDDLMITIQEEISLDGERGCDLNRLWTFVEKFFEHNALSFSLASSDDASTNLQQPHIIDDSMKSFLWKQIAELDGLQFLLDEEKTSQKTVKGKDGNDKKSNKSTKKKTAIKKPQHIENIQKMEYNTVVKKHGTRLRVVAKLELQQKAIIGNLHPSTPISSQTYPVLETITRSRAIGITQTDIATELGLDPRSVFHYIKMLCNMGLVQKFPVVTKGTYTNLCLHNRYAKLNPSYAAVHDTPRNLSILTADATENLSRMKFSNPEVDSAGNVNENGVSFHTDLVKQKVTELLNGARNKVMLTADLMNALGFDVTTKKSRKWFNRCLDALVQKGYIEKINVPRKDKGADRCVRLLKLFEPTISGTGSRMSMVGGVLPRGTAATQSIGDIGNQYDNDEDCRVDALLVDLPFETQVYRLIKQGGDTGIIAGDIHRTLNNINVRLLHKILDRMVKKPPKGMKRFSVHRVLEFQGKERRYRYFTRDAFKVVQTREGLSENIDSGSDEDVEEDIEENVMDEEEIEKSFIAKLGKKLGRPRKAIDASDVKIRNPRGRPRKTGNNPPATPKKRGRPKRKPESALPDDRNGDSDAAMDIDIPTTREQPGTRSDMLPVKQTVSMETNTDLVVSTSEARLRIAQDLTTDSDMQDAIVAGIQEQENGIQMDEDVTNGNHMQSDKSNVMLCMICGKEFNADGVRPHTEDLERQLFCGDECRQKKPLAKTQDVALQNADTQALQISPTTRMNEDLSLSAISPIIAEENHQQKRLDIAQVASTSSSPSKVKSPSKPSKKVPFGEILKATNTTAEKRKRILLHLLDENRILEMGHMLTKAYQEVEQKLNNGIPSPHTIDKKTLGRSADTLEEQGLLNQLIVKVPLLNGQSVTRILLLHKDVNRSDPEVKNYIEMMQDRSILVGNPVKPQRNEQVAMDVERLDDMRKRMVIGNESGKVSSSLPNFYGRTRKPKASTSVKRMPASNDEWWLSIAQDYGWINAKMLRAKLLHQFLFSLFASTQQDSRIDLTDRTIQTSMLLRDMPFSLYLKCIGLMTRSQEVTEYINSGKEMNLKLVDLPIEIRTTILQGNYKYRNHLKQLLDILLALGIIKVAMVDKDLGSKSILAAAYQLQTTVRMYDYSMPLPDRQFIREYQLNTIEDVMIYWSELQYLSENADKTLDAGYQSDNLNEDEENSGQRKRKRRKAARTASSLNSSEDDPLKHISSARNWRATYIFTTAQRKVLEENLDRTNGETPLNDDDTCRRIADNIGLMTQRVKFYFKRIEDLHAQKIAAKETAKVVKFPDRRRKRPSNTTTSKETELPFKEHNQTANFHMRIAKKSSEKIAGKSTENSSLTKRNKPVSPKGNKDHSITKNARRSTREYVKRRQFKNSSNDEEENLPVIGDEERFEIQYEPQPKRIRPNWTAAEDDILIYAYAILKVRAKSSRIIWSPIQGVLPDRTPELCRRRLQVIQKNAAEVDRIDNLVTQWEHIYQNAISKGILQREKPDSSNYSIYLQVLVEYFMKTAVSIQQNPTLPRTPLPRDTTMLNTFMEVIPFTPSSSDDIYYFQERVFERVSLRAKKALLDSFTFAACLGNLTTMDIPMENSFVEENRKVELVKSLVKMILMTPEDQYDSTHAFAILNTYPHEVINRALEESKNMGTIVRIRGGSDRRVPGRGYNISDKFLSTMTANLPDRLFTQASGFHKYVMNNSTIPFSPLANNGTAAAVLNLLSNRKISLNFKDSETAHGKQVIPNYRSRKIDKQRLDFDVFIEPINIQTQSINDTSIIPNLFTSSTLSIQEIADTNPGQYINGLLAKMKSMHERKEVEIVFNMIAASEVAGITLLALKEAIVQAGIIMTDQRLHALLSALISHQPSLIASVGFTEQQLISSLYLSEWMAKTATRHTTEKNGDADFNRKPFGPARMWFDINGNIIPSVLRGCMEAVLAMIIEKPGIYKSNIFRKFALVMSRCELDDVLEHLIIQGAVISKSIIKPPEVTLFSKPRTFIECDATTIHRNKITCYFVNEEYYMKTVPICDK